MTVDLTKPVRTVGDKLAVRIFCTDRVAGDDGGVRPPVVGLVMEPPREVTTVVEGTVLRGVRSAFEAVWEGNLDGTCPGNADYDLENVPD